MTHLQNIQKTEEEKRNLEEKALLGIKFGLITPENRLYYYFVNELNDFRERVKKERG